jgi:hypothetical protein
MLCSDLYPLYPLITGSCTCAHAHAHTRTETVQKNGYNGYRGTKWGRSASVHAGFGCTQSLDRNGYTSRRALLLVEENAGQRWFMRVYPLLAKTGTPGFGLPNSLISTPIPPLCRELRRWNAVCGYCCVAFCGLFPSRRHIDRTRRERNAQRPWWPLGVVRCIDRVVSSCSWAQS